MAKLSLGAAWTDSAAFVRQEAGLVLPVALLFIALPAVALQQMMPPELAEWMMSREVPRPPLPDIPLSFPLAAVVTSLIALFGTLCVYALALRGGISVGEALGLAARRFPAMLLATLIVMGILMVMTLILSLIVGLLALVIPAEAVVSMLTTAVTLLVILMMVRLMLLGVEILERTDGAMVAVRRSLLMTRGQTWRLLLFVLAFILIATLAGGIAQLVFGSLAGLLGGRDMALLFGGLAEAIASAIVQVYALVMMTRFHRQLSATVPA